MNGSANKGPKSSRRTGNAPSERVHFDWLGQLVAFFLAVAVTSFASAVGAPASLDLSGSWVAHLAMPSYWHRGKGESVLPPVGELVLRLDGTQGGDLTGFLMGWSAMLDERVENVRVTGDAVYLTLEGEVYGRLRERYVTGRVRGSSLNFDGADLLLGPSLPHASASARAARGVFEHPAIFRRGTPTTSYRASPVDYRMLPRISLPSLRTLPWNGLAGTPPMGVDVRTDERTVREIADAMVLSGMRDAGYRYVIQDDGWEGTRDAHGLLHPNPRFPDMKALADYIHARGLMFGVYSSPGPLACRGFEGSYGREVIDARTWARWGVDYLKYDWCTAYRIWPTADMRPVYQRMAEALRATGRPIVFSLSPGADDGLDHVGTWGPLVGGNLWRTTRDIDDTWRSMMHNIVVDEKLWARAGPGYWNDPDMLQVGDGGMSPDEYRTQFSLWAIAAAPLIASNDPRRMTAITRSILLNRDVIAVDQDRLGRQGRLLAHDGDVDVWARPLAGGAYALAFVNRGERAAFFRPNFPALGLSGHFSGRDLWRHLDLGILSASYAVHIPPHGVAMLKLTR